MKRINGISECEVGKTYYAEGLTKKQDSHDKVEPYWYLFTCTGNNGDNISGRDFYESEPDENTGSEWSLSKEDIDLENYVIMEMTKQEFEDRYPEYFI